MIVMPPFQWTHELTIFQPEFDAEHREVLRLCDELHRGVQAGADAGVVEGLVRQLVAEVEAHFVHEERLMRIRRFGGYAWHKRQHDAARHKMQTVGATAPGELPALLARWVHDHACVADRMMASSLRNLERVSQVFTATKKVRPSPKSPAIPRSPAS